MTALAWTPLGVLARAAAEESRLRTEYPVSGLSTGVDSIDEVLRPSLEPGRLIVIAGESGRGKTALAAQLAVAFAHQVPVAWWSLEDDAVDAARRTLANVARVPVSGLRQGFRVGSVPDAVDTGVALLEQLPIDVVDAHTDVLGLGATARRWCEARGASGPFGGVLIVDQLSHIADTAPTPKTLRTLQAAGLPVPPGPRELEHHVLDWKTGMLREIATRLHLLVVLLHQLNQVREDDGRPSERSVRGSQGVVHKADALIVPWRPRTIANPFAGGPGVPDRIPAPEDAAELICLKSRASASGWTVPLRWDGTHQRFAEAQEQDLTSAFSGPAAPGEQATEGALLLADLRSRLQAQRQALHDQALQDQALASVPVDDAPSASAGDD